MSTLGSSPASPRGWRRMPPSRESSREQKTRPAPYCCKSSTRTLVLFEMQRCIARGRHTSVARAFWVGGREEWTWGGNERHQVDKTTNSKANVLNFPAVAWACPFGPYHRNRQILSKASRRSHFHPLRYSLSLANLPIQDLKSKCPEPPSWVRRTPPDQVPLTRSAGEHGRPLCSPFKHPFSDTEGSGGGDFWTSFCPYFLFSVVWRASRQFFDSYGWGGKKKFWFRSPSKKVGGKKIGADFLLATPLYCLFALF